jgi:hypothetical protein
MLRDHIYTENLKTLLFLMTTRCSGAFLPGTIQCHDQDIMTAYSSKVSRGALPFHTGISGKVTLPALTHVLTKEERSNTPSKY